MPYTLIEENGCLYTAKNGNAKKIIANWRPEIIGMVKDNDITEGFIIQHPPATAPPETHK